MGKIMKRKKKKGGGGRTAAAAAKIVDVKSHHQQSPASESDHKRNTRRRNHQTYDSDDDESEEERDARRKQRKMKLVLRLPAGSYHHHQDEVFSGVDSVTSPYQNGGGRRRRRPRLKRLELVSETTSTEYGCDQKIQKRKIEAGSVDGFKDSEEDDDEDGCDQKIQKTKKERGHNVDTKRMGFYSGVPLPDRQQLELILDKLQRKDTYGVFARPVDPEELPDYYDVIEHPMDFGTIRRKLAGGIYSNLEELENDVHLVCSNAMQYNAAETVYFKQANLIQELARTKFQNFRIDSEHANGEAKSEQKTCDSSVKKPEKNSPCTPFQEPVGSDFSSGATLASAVDTRALSEPAVQADCEKPTSSDGLVNENSSLTENKPDEAEEQLSEKDVPTKPGKRLVVIDENRRKTYTISSEPVVHTESIFTPFAGETKQLVDVVLHEEDHSYARSLARFAADLGPFAWKVASPRIEQSLPTGMNFGRGWIGENKPLPKPSPMPRSRTKSAQATLSPKVAEWRTRNSSVVAPSGKLLDPASNSPFSRPVSARKPVPVATNKQENKSTVNFAKPENISRQIELNSSPPSSGTPRSASPRNPFSRDSKANNPTLQMVSRNGNVDQSAAFFKKPQVAGEVTIGTNNDWVGHSAEFISNTEARSGTHSPRGNQCRGTNNVPNQMMRGLAEKTQHQLTSSKPSTFDIQQHMMSAPSQRRNDSSAEATVGRPNPRMLSEKTEHPLKWQNRPTTDTRELMMSVPSPRRSDSSATASDRHRCLSNASQMPRMLTEKTHQQLKSTNPPTIGTQRLMMSVPYPRRDGSSAAATDHHQGLSNPNQMPKMLAEKTQQQQLKPSNPPITGSTPQLMTPLSSPKTDDSSAAATAAARAWMSLGAPHLKPAERSDPPRMEMPAASGGLQFQSLNRFHPQLLGREREPHFQNGRQMGFPQRVTADLSQFQMRPPWQGFIQRTPQTNEKRHMLPPDLNITFQSSGSPGILSDSQLPDLALQL